MNVRLVLLLALFASLPLHAQESLDVKVSKVLTVDANACGKFKRNLKELEGIEKHRGELMTQLSSVIGTYAENDEERAAHRRELAELDSQIRELNVAEQALKAAQLEAAENPVARAVFVVKSPLAPELLKARLFRYPTPQEDLNLSPAVREIEIVGGATSTEGFNGTETVVKIDETFAERLRGPGVEVTVAFSASGACPLFDSAKKKFSRDPATLKSYVSFELK